MPPIVFTIDSKFICAEDVATRVHVPAVSREVDGMWHSSDMQRKHKEIYFFIREI